MKQAFSARHPFWSTPKSTKLGTNQCHIKDMGTSSSRKLCRVTNYLLYSPDPQKTYLKIDVYTNISNVGKWNVNGTQIATRDDKVRSHGHTSNCLWVWVISHCIDPSLPPPDWRTICRSEGFPRTGYVTPGICR